MRFQLSILFILFFILGCGGPSKNFTTQKLSILQGLTTASSSQISVLRHKSQNYKYDIEPKIQQVRIKQKGMSKSPWVIDHISLENLDFKTDYKLVIRDQNKKVVDTRDFRSLDLAKKEIHFAVASCMDDRLPPTVQKEMWASFIKQKADLHFFIGDNVYGDVGILQKGLAQPEELWRRYAETRNSLDIFKAQRLTPTLAIWDDHDYGSGDGDSSYPYKSDSTNTFYSYFAQDPIESSHFEKGPGISFLYRIAGQNFYFLDNRSFRTGKKIKPDSHWGTAQEKWLLKNLHANKNFSWLINGNQFYGDYHRFESFQKNHPDSFKKITGQIKKLKNRVAFISGDRHLFETMEIKKPDLNYSTVELTTSGIHAKVFPSSWNKSPNPRQLFGMAEKYNFATVVSSAKKKGALISVKGIGPGDEVFYQLKKHIK